MNRIAISEFKAICLRLLTQIKRTGEPVTVTRNGEPLVVVYPAPDASERPSFGSMKSSGEILGDITVPLEDQEWEVLK